MKQILLAVLALSLTVSAVCAREPAAVWFAPDPDTPDFTDLFTKPQLWPKARQRVDVFLVGPEQLFTRADLTNDLATLQGVDAYRKMQQWNMDIAIDAPSVKPWDCTGQGDRAKDPRSPGNAKAETLKYIKNVFTAACGLNQPRVRCSYAPKYGLISIVYLFTSYPFTSCCAVHDTLNIAFEPVKSATSDGGFGE